MRPSQQVLFHGIRLARCLKKLETERYLSPLPFVTEIRNDALIELSERNGLETRMPTCSGF